MKLFNIEDLSGLAFLKEGLIESEINHELLTNDNEVILKHTANIFIGAHFEYMSRNRGIKTAIFSFKKVRDAN